MITEQDKEEVRRIVQEELSKFALTIPAGTSVQFVEATPGYPAGTANAVPANCVCHSDTQRSICNYGCMQYPRPQGTFKVSYNPNHPET